MSFGSSAGDFGSVTLSGNSNLQIRGERNQGAITQTSNLNIFSINCVLNLITISSGKMNVENSNLQVYLCPNLSLDGKGNTAVLSDNSNSKFSGDNNQWDAKDNANLDVWGTGNILKINRNSNSKFGGDRCNVVAEDNSNLSVLGDDLKVSVRGTSNHVVTKSTETGSVNKLEISPGFNASKSKRSAGWINSTISMGRSNSSGNNDKFTIDYVDEVVINQNNYKVGLFAFTVKGRSATNYEVKLDESGLDAGSLVVNSISPSEVVLSVTKQGVKQNLKVQGRSVKSQDGPDKVFHVEHMQSNM